jgi:very-short-patch-repair endonuclease
MDLANYPPWRWVPPSPEMVEAARELRKRMTPAEALLWDRLCSRRLLGRKFRRQHPVGQFVLDFLCDEDGLVVELDGAVHDHPDQRERDAYRQKALEALELTVLRFRNEMVLADLDVVLTRITHELTRQKPALPSPEHKRGAGGEGMAGISTEPALPSPEHGRGAGGEG